jgi:hypothetical protein
MTTAGQSKLDPRTPNEPGDQSAARRSTGVKPLDGGNSGRKKWKTTSFIYQKYGVYPIEIVYFFATNKSDEGDCTKQPLDLSFPGGSF